jgi:hypothetical protein
VRRLAPPPIRLGFVGRGAKRLGLVDLLDLVERELDRHLALEDVHEHL